MHLRTKVGVTEFKKRGSSGAEWWRPVGMRAKRVIKWRDRLVPCIKDHKMVSFSVKPCFLCSLLLLFLSIAPSSCSTPIAVIERICSKTRNPALCLGILKSKPAPNDVPYLGYYTINITRANASNTLNLIQSLMKQTSDAALRKSYTNCSEAYKLALGSLDSAEQCLKSLRIKDMYLATGDVLAAVGYCDSLAPPDPLPKRNRDVGDLDIVVMELAGYLLGWI